MKSQILLSVFFMAGLFASAQNNQKKVKITAKSELEYTVGNDGKTKDGLYYIKNLGNSALWVQGHYKNNARSGTWYFFNGKSELTMRYNYDQQKLLFIDTTALHNVKVQVLSDDAAVAKNASAPLPLCPVDYYVTLLGTEIYNNYNDQENENLTAEITAHIDTKGKAVYTLAYIYKGKKTPMKEIELTSAFPVEWVPSKFNDKTVPSEFTVYADINANGGTQDHMARFRWDN